MASKVFISWGGNLSKRLAEEIKKWLPSVLQFVKPYFTPDDIEKGARWESNIAQELSSSNIGIICLTKDNINRPWILFEAGALSKNLEKSNVCTILFNVDSSEITGPLTCFQATKFDEADFKKLIKTINNTGGESKLEPAVLDEVFNMWWPRLKERIEQIIREYKDEPHTEDRTEREILEEVLDLTRMYAKRSPRKSEARHALKRLLITLDNMQMRVPMMGEHSSTEYFEELYPAIEILCMELDCPSLFEEFMMRRREFIHMTR